MDDNARRKRELQATLDQIRSFQDRMRRGWRLDVPLWKLAIQGVLIFVFAFAVGLGLAVIFRVIFGG